MYRCTFPSVSRPCFNILADAFPGRLQLVPGRSQQTLPRWARENQLRADLIHIDGAHEPEARSTKERPKSKLDKHGPWISIDKPISHANLYDFIMMCNVFRAFSWRVVVVVLFLLLSLQAYARWFWGGESRPAECKGSGQTWCLGGLWWHLLLASPSSLERSVGGPTGGATQWIHHVLPYKPPWYCQAGRVRNIMEYPQAACIFVCIFIYIFIYLLTAFI